ncbi:MAG: hypothetical protein PF495_03515 [Spirochaetales bacterium]|jgi:tRNA-specific 2-thiouridylase|nr:hypothetical protein [Spirochaetales bacterium]
MTKALALFSGGLDSILACKVIQDQGVPVQALKFVSPFFEYELLQNKAKYQKTIFDQYGINVDLIDITDEYLEMLAAPVHGYGKNFNPCIDCKILFIAKAKSLLNHYGASFLITGEVVGQRPMSQRKDTLRVIERDTGTDNILLRPLCSQSQKPTDIENSGLINREKLPHFSGRNRTPQMELAKQFGITDFPTPAGGCVLTEELRAASIKKLFTVDQEVITPQNILFLLTGRVFLLPQGGWFTLGRDMAENEAIEKMYQHGDSTFRISKDRPGPLGLLRYGSHDRDLTLAATITAHYAKKILPPPDVEISGQQPRTIKVAPILLEEIEKYLWAKI